MGSQSRAEREKVNQVSIKRGSSRGKLRKKPTEREISSFPQHRRKKKRRGNSKKQLLCLDRRKKRKKRYCCSLTKTIRSIYGAKGPSFFGGGWGGEETAEKGQSERCRGKSLRFRKREGPREQNRASQSGGVNRRPKRAGTQCPPVMVSVNRPRVRGGRNR